MNEPASKNPAIIELLASRICHDLISPVGAVANGIEFLEEVGPDAGQDAINLISYSAAQASAKLQAFRLAYGAGGRDPNLKPEDVHKTFQALIVADGKITQTWDPHAPIGFDPLPQAYCKILMCALMLATESLPKGGEITLAPGSAPSQTIITAKGDGCFIRDRVNDALSRAIELDALDPRLVHPYAIGTLADYYGFAVTLEKSSDGSVLCAIKLKA